MTGLKVFLFCLKLPPLYPHFVRMDLLANNGSTFQQLFLSSYKNACDVPKQLYSALDGTHVQSFFISFALVSAVKNYFSSSSSSSSAFLNFIPEALSGRLCLAVFKEARMLAFSWEIRNFRLYSVQDTRINALKPSFTLIVSSNIQRNISRRYYSQVVKSAEFDFSKLLLKVPHWRCGFLQCYTVKVGALRLYNYYCHPPFFLWFLHEAVNSCNHIYLFSSIGKHFWRIPHKWHTKSCDCRKKIRCVSVCWKGKENFFLI